ncbi:hypothetical protein [uncultured Alistipes sp.]|uniref:hypothetical protein n=1 Tax=uncultured Alistipes sp. TaxID=538949 RepID=UPI00261721C0|nr:hypothetical protein [uncultured Alistipes sp.]
MELLQNSLKRRISELPEAEKEIRDRLGDELLDRLYSVYPFNRFEYIISHLIATRTISLPEYLDLRNDYMQRNKYLHIFQITAPRTFGETWAQRHLNEIVPELLHPRKSYDSNYSGQYDFWYNGIRIEVKASRAVKRGSDAPLIEKALSSDSAEGFDMNFQQIKPACCDVFVWIAVWRDKIRYWVLSSDEVKSNKYYSAGQHRGNTGEGQLWITNNNISDFNAYETNVHTILDKIIEKGTH